MVDLVGQRFGNFKLIRKLGSGGFAAVYLGEHIHLGSEAAIKVLRDQLLDADKGLFRTEGRNLVRLIHPNIVRLLDFGLENNIPYLVMEHAFLLAPLFFTSNKLPRLSNMLTIRN